MRLAAPGEAKSSALAARTAAGSASKSAAASDTFMSA
uniref:Uncharacterized protein n=1 Tax=Arundo donax TaxID=35708 RepID=A0A0A9GJH3_ARUDO